jgi:hypothetical protein
MAVGLAEATPFFTGTLARMACDAHPSGCDIDMRIAVREQLAICLALVEHNKHASSQLAITLLLIPRTGASGAGFERPGAQATVKRDPFSITAKAGTCDLFKLVISEPGLVKDYIVNIHSTGPLGDGENGFRLEAGRATHVNASGSNGYANVSMGGQRTDRGIFWGAHANDAAASIVAKYTPAGLAIMCASDPATVTLIASFSTRLAFAIREMGRGADALGNVAAREAAARRTFGLAPAAPVAGGLSVLAALSELPVQLNNYSALYKSLDARASRPRDIGYQVALESILLQLGSSPADAAREADDLFRRRSVADMRATRDALTSAQAAIAHGKKFFSTPEGGDSGDVSPW